QHVRLKQKTGLAEIGTVSPTYSRFRLTNLKITLPLTITRHISPIYGPVFNHQKPSCWELTLPNLPVGIFLCYFNLTCCASSVYLAVATKAQIKDVRRLVFDVHHHLLYSSIIYKL